MSDSIICEETVPGYFLVFSRTPKRRTVRPVATIEERCGRWLWWMRDESDIGLCDTRDEAKDAIRGIVGNTHSDGFVPPTVQEVREVADAYCRSRNVDPSTFDAELFIECHEAMGWTTADGLRPLKDWKESLRSEIRRGAAAR